jgi:hypothetical protein
MLMNQNKSLILTGPIREIVSRVGHYFISNSHVLECCETCCKEFVSNPSIPITLLALKATAGTVM